MWQTTTEPTEFIHLPSILISPQLPLSFKCCVRTYILYASYMSSLIILHNYITQTYGPTRIIREFETIYVYEICPLVGGYAAYSGKPLRAFRDTLKMGPIGRPETSVRIYHYKLSNIPQKRGFHPLCDGSLKSSNFCTWLSSASLMLPNRAPTFVTSYWHFDMDMSNGRRVLTVRSDDLTRKT
jgi:hypothetical protein